MEALMGRARLFVSRFLLLPIAALICLGWPAPASAAEWVQNFVATDLWSGPGASAISFGQAQPWDYFQVITPQAGARLHVLVARTNDYAFIDASTVGPSGPPPVGWPTSATPAVAAAEVAPTTPPVFDATPTVSTSPTQPFVATTGGLVSAEQALWPALQALQSLQHTWTLQALAFSGTRLEWEWLQAQEAGAYYPDESRITLNLQWYSSDPRALAAVIEHEAKHVADRLAGMDIQSAPGCIATEINALHEEAKTWGELVGASGKPRPRDELEKSLNFKLSLLRRGPAAIRNYVVQNVGYRAQCQVLG
jgi:hypothetical protein